MLINHQNNFSELQTRHYKEFQSSAIVDDIIALNFESISQDEAFAFLSPNPDRLNTGRLTAGALKKYNLLVDGGWRCIGIDLLTMNPSAWGCVKPKYRRNEIKKETVSGVDTWVETGKSIKYEHPIGTPTELFCLRVSYAIGLKCARKAGLAAEQSYLAHIGLVDDITIEDVGFWQWVLDNPKITIVITEGAKKAASMLSAGYIAVGLPGIYGGYRSKRDGLPVEKHLIPQLGVFKDREITFCFDNDTKPKTIQAVRSAIEQTGKLLNLQNCKVSVMSWDADSKGVDDLIVDSGVDFLDGVFVNRLALAQWKLATSFDLSQYPATHVNSRYLDPSVKPDNRSGKIIAVKSPKGTGKTEWLAKLCEPSIAIGQPIIIITHRILLAKALADRTGINHIEEVRSSEIGSLLGYSLCVDSLHPKKFNPEDWRGALVIIDECEQVFWHMLNSSTCQHNRVAILETFEKLLKIVANSGGTICLSDADLSKVSINYIDNNTDKKLKLWLMVNSYNPNHGKRVVNVYGSNEIILKEAVTSLQNNHKIIVHVSAQKVKSKYSAKNLQTLLSKAFPNKKILVIDAETVADLTHPAYGCIDRINQVVIDYDVIIATPTIETGISIDVNHFDSVWCMANGVQTVDAVCQTIERVRSDVPRHICITTGAIRKVGNGATDVKSLLRSVHKKCDALSQILQYDAIVNADEEVSQKIHQNTWGLLACKVNTGFADYPNAILDKLKREGYLIKLHEIDSDNPKTKVELSEIKAEVEDAREVNYQAERESIVLAEIPDDKQYKKLKGLRAKTQHERTIQRKGDLVRRYLTEDITDDLIIKDDDGWYAKLQTHYYLTNGREFLAGRDIGKLEALTKGSGQAFKPDASNSCMSLKITALELFDVSQFIGEDKSFTARDFEDWNTKVVEHRWSVREWLGITIPVASTPIKTVQLLLGVMGLSLGKSSRPSINGERVRVYPGAEVNPDNRTGILDRWESKSRSCDGGTVQTSEPTYLEAVMAEASRPPYKVLMEEVVDAIAVDVTPVDAIAVDINLSVCELSDSEQNHNLSDSEHNTTTTQNTTESLKGVTEGVSDKRYRHRDNYHVRGCDTGILEGIQANGEYLIYWLSDEVNQIALAFRSYLPGELVEISV